MVKVNEILNEVFGFESEKDWGIGKDGEFVEFPIRELIEVGRKNGLNFVGVREGVYLYERRMGDNVIKVKVKEGNKKLELEFEYCGENLKFVEKV